MVEQIYIGIDLHQRTLSYCVMNKDGQILKEDKITTEKHGIQTVFSQYPGAEVVMEPVTQHWCVSDWISECGCIIHIAHATDVKAIAHAKLKNDTIDAQVLAHLLRTDLLPEAHLSSREQRSLKALVRTRRHLVDQQTDIKNQIHALIWKEGLRGQGGDIASPSNRMYINACLVDESYRFVIERLFASLDALREQIVLLEKKIKEEVKGNRSMEILLSVPGISYTLGSIILSEIGDVTRFDSPKKLQSYAGLTPWIRSSGETSRTGCISKKGSSHLRWALCEVAVIQTRCHKTPGFGEYYLGLKQRTHTGTATVATARKLTGLIWRLLTEDRLFEVRESAFSVLSPVGLSS